MAKYQITNFYFCRMCGAVFLSYEEGQNKCKRCGCSISEHWVRRLTENRLERIIINQEITIKSLGKEIEKLTKKGENKK